LFPCLLAVFLGTVLAIEWLRANAARLSLLDRPGGRKAHHRVTPAVGGLGIAFGLLLVWLMVPGTRPPAWLIFGYSALVLIGAMDDRKPISAKTKLLLEIVVVGVSLGGASLGLERVGEILPGLQVEFGPLALPLAIFAVLSVINAYNMIDGVDGLSGSIGAVGFAGLAFAAWLSGGAGIVIVLILPMAALAGFLLFNLRLPKRRAALVFMGDAGSLSLGFLLSVFALLVTQSEARVPAMVAVWICALPLLDSLNVIQRRSARGARLTAPAADHLHHLLGRFGYSPARIVLIETLAALCLACIGLLLWVAGVSDWLSLMLLLVIALVSRRLCDEAWTRLDAAQEAGREGGDQTARPMVISSGVDTSVRPDRQES
jgi:UDP-GlcNAc:undecaprenyl-phosphate GlcNAc-1-phosphate transferase